MKIHIKTVYFLLIINLLTCKCVKEKPDFCELIDIESHINNFEQLNISQFSDLITYVPLETIENQSFGIVGISDISGNLILFSGECLLYDTSGRFINKIGNQGRGPKEYRFYENACFGYHNNLFFQDLYDLLEFDLDGSFIKRYKNIFVIEADKYIKYWQPLNDSTFFGNIGNSNGQIDLKAIILNNNGEVKYSYKNFELFHLKQTLYGGYPALASFYKYDNKLFYKAFYNDTLFYLSNNFELIPRYVFRLGKFREPIEERDLLLNDNCVYVVKIFQTPDYLFIVCDFRNHYPAKRLTPLEIMPGIRPIWYNSRYILGIYDLKTRKLTFSKPTSTDNPLNTSGLYNDIDGGPRFMPQRMVNDSTMVMCITAKRLKEHIASDEFKGNISKYPEKKKKLEEMANRLTEFDNPILMFVTFVRKSNK